jgi:DNA-binding NtrC family response regulator
VRRGRKATGLKQTAGLPGWYKKSRVALKIRVARLFCYGRMSERKILVVDDEASIREMLEMALGKAGYLVRLAIGAEEALGILRKEYIPVMFIDLGLEKMNGFELCANIRKRNPEAIIYALTGYAGIFWPQEMLAAGFNDYFAKPISLKYLCQAVKESFIKLDNKGRARKQGGTDEGEVF